MPGPRANDRRKPERAFAALALMRREGVSLREAAAAQNTSPRTVLRYVGSALRQQNAHGRFKPSPYDRFARTLNFVTPAGPQPVTVRSSRTASRIAEHSNALRIYRNTGDTTALDKFRGKSFRSSGKTYEFVTDPAVLDRLADAKEFPENFYVMATGMVG